MAVAGLPALQSGEPGQVRKEAATAGLCKCRGSGSPLTFLYAMSYQVLARKWRPKDFGSLVGQEHVVRALRHALDAKRLHHAYLFTGTRGVGKTTLARILAKCLNCETGVTSQPCGKCSACVEIDAGRFVDLLEVDAATNTKVDEMRQLLETAQYAPTKGRYKVYVIDEVHQLSGHAFNAMLKTLEEPPEHMKFVLATTDPQKIPVTVLSRCLQFNLKQMPPAAIVAALGDLAALLLKLALAQTLPATLAEDPERARLAELAAAMDAESLQLYYQIALQGREDLPLAPDEHGGFVMTLLRMLAFRPEGAGERIEPAAAKRPPPKAETPKAAGWPELVQQLPVAGAARELARNAELQRREGNAFELVVPKEKAYLAERGYTDKLKGALEQHLGAAVTVKVNVGDTVGTSAAALEAGERDARRAAAAQSMQSDGFVKDLVNLFDAKVVDATIKEERK